MRKMGNRNRGDINKKLIYIIIVSIFEWYQLDISCNLPKEVHVIDWKCIVLNLSMLMVINLFIYLLVNRLWLTVVMSEVVWTAVALINYYVIQYHGMPFTITEIKNFYTALNVLKSYNLSIGIIPIQIIVICGCLILFSFYERKNGGIIKRNIKSVSLLCMSILICAIYILIGFCGTNPIKPKKTIGWSWKEAYGKYGYIACVIEDLYFKSNAINRPEDYSYENVEAVHNQYVNETETIDKEMQNYSDIIFIVNETFYDLQHVANFETDVDYLKNIRKMDNLIRGYAVSPTPYGGTNSSEYELLTSNSLYIMNSGITPFNAIDLKGAASIVSYLKSLGYNTLGTHTESGINYNRIRGYVDLGFDIIKFEDEYKDLEYYYGRWYETDASVYKNLERWYEDMGNGPRFLYLLTIQNHGNWDLNESEYDTVHVVQSEFEMTDTVNEYLTSISLSDEAFFELTEYFKNVDRPVIICMVGDHCPSFAGEIADVDLSTEEKALKLRETPLYIWANYELDESELGTVGMIFVVPVLLKAANIPLSGYYQYLLDVKEYVPIITSYGKYFDTDYNCFSVGEGQYGGLVSEYYQVEYSNIKDTSGKFCK